MASLMPRGKQAYFDNAGDPLAGGRLYTYAAGTSTPLATYSDQAGAVPNTNPVVLDARGEATVFWGAALQGRAAHRARRRDLDAGRRRPIGSGGRVRAPRLASVHRHTDRARPRDHHRHRLDHGAEPRRAGGRRGECPRLRGRPSASAAVNTAALTAALTVADHVFVSSGVYDPIEISQSGKTLTMDADVVFRLPDGTVEAVDTTGPDVVKISGSDVDIFGNFTVDGNADHNDSSGFSSAEHVGTLKITGGNVVIRGRVHCLNPYS